MADEIEQEKKVKKGFIYWPIILLSPLIMSNVFLFYLGFFFKCLGYSYNVNSIV